jgi:hypothetical protein
MNFRGLLQAETGITTVASVNSDDAPDIYLKGNQSRPIPPCGALNGRRAL